MRIRVVLALLVVAAACGDDSGTTTSLPSDGASTTTGSTATTTTRVPIEGELWGFTPFPARPDLNGVIEAYRIADDHGNLIAHHLDECVPWDAMLNHTELPYDTGDRLQLRVEQSPPDSVVYVAVSFTSITRDEIAPECGAIGPPGSFGDPAALTAARAWVDHLIARFDPMFFNVGVEFNLFGSHRPDQAAEFEAFTLDLIDHIHATHPGVTVLVSVQFETLGEVAEVATVADAADLVGVSIYPTAFGAATPPAEDALDDLVSLGKPLAIAETGWPGAPTVVGGSIRPFTEQGQAAYVEWLGAMVARHDLKFVVWFFPADPGPVFATGPPELQSIAEPFATMGLVSDDRVDRAALEVWDRLREG